MSGDYFFDGHKSGHELRASIIICTYRRDAVLCETIRYVLQTCPVDCELLVVDQVANHDAVSTEFLSEAQSRGQIRYFNLEKSGLTQARNYGARTALGEILIFLDDDVIPCPALIMAHLSAYADSEIKAVAGQVLNPGESPAFAPGMFTHTEPVRHFGGLYGANFSIRRSVFIEIGGADERLGIHAYTEDVLLARRLTECGHEIIFEPQASVRHLAYPRGGCRITDPSQSTAESSKSHSKLLLFHLKSQAGDKSRWRTLREALRQGPLRRENVMRPWRQPWAWLEFIKSYLKSKSDARH